MCFVFLVILSPRFSPFFFQEQLERYGVVASLPTRHRFAKVTPGIPRLDVIQKKVDNEKKLCRMIRISTFDEKDVEKLITIVRQEDLGGEDVYLAAFRIRMECNNERQVGGCFVCLFGM